MGNSDLTAEKELAKPLGKEIVLLGVGETGRQILTMLEQRGVNIAGAIFIPQEKDPAKQYSGLPAGTLQALADCRLAILLADYGERGTAELAHRVAADISRPALSTLAFAIVPEGYRQWPRTEQVWRALRDLRDVANSVFIISGRPANAGKSVSSAYMQEALRQICHTLSHLLLLTKKYSINPIVVGDLAHTLEHGGFGLCCSSQADGKDRISLVINRLLQGICLPNGLADAACAVLCISAPPGMPLEQVEKAVGLLRMLFRSEISPLMGIRMGDSLDEQLRLTLFVAGIEDKLVQGRNEQWA